MHLFQLRQLITHAPLSVPCALSLGLNSKEQQALSLVWQKFSHKSVPYLLTKAQQRVFYSESFMISCAWRAYCQRSCLLV